jgi:hypothetical protein
MPHYMGGVFWGFLFVRLFLPVTDESGA